MGAQKITVLDHPVALGLLSRLRDCTTSPADFRWACYRLSWFLAAEASKDLRTERYPIETPLERMEGFRVSQPVSLVGILRAGLGILHGLQDFFPNATVGYVGMERDESTAEARAYYEKVPDLKGRRTFLVDPMLATGGSAIQAAQRLLEAGARELAFLCIVASPEGIAALQKSVPSTPIITAAIDRELDEHKYILPGLGDFGDRLYGTF